MTPFRPSAPVTRARFLGTTAFGLAVAAAAVAAGLLLGAERVDVGAVLGGGGTPVERDIFLRLRLPRVLTGALVGGALALGGTTFQLLLRNPLADPYLLGISGGGAFGAVLSIVAVGAGSLPFLAARSVAALAGCLVALALVWFLASRSGPLRPATLLLAGVVVNAFFLAGLACVQYAAAPTEAQAILRWVMGGLETGGPGEVVVLAAVVPLALLLLLRDASPLHALAFGEETARHLGVEVERVRRRALLVSAALTAACVAVAGPIGFVGLVVPHGARLLVGADPRLLLPAAFLAGTAFLPLADAAARTLLAPRELPVGIVTAVVGAPAFAALLVRRTRTGPTASAGEAGRG